MPYSGQACKYAGEKLGLTGGKTGYNYARHNTNIKGCYAYSGKHTEYKGSYWYGMGASAEIKGSLDHTEDFYRPEGFDCQKRKA